MTKAFLPSQIVPGAHLITDALGVPLKDRKGRVIWEMPKPSKYVRHFLNAGMRSKFEKVRRALAVLIENGSVKPSDANKQLEDMLRKVTKMVPIYRGIPARIAHDIRHVRRIQG